MEAPFTSHHFSDDEGRPAGGSSYGDGFTVSWQNGPLGRGDSRSLPNGAFVETIIAVAVDRLEYYQSSGFACAENQAAIDALLRAKAELESRTARREQAGIEGTHGVDRDHEAG